MSGPRIAVLGGNGRVGRLMSRRLRPLRATGLVRVQSRTQSGDTDWVCDPDDTTLVSHLRAFAPDLIAVLWGVTPRDAGDLDLNTSLAIKAAELAAAAGCSRLAITSSSAVYGAPDASGAMDEAHILRPVNDYGIAKVRMERAVQQWCAESSTGTSVAVLRLANVIGCDMLGDAVRSALADGPVVLDQFENGRGAVRSYLGPATLLDALVVLASASLQRHETFNLANGSCGVEMAAILDALQAERIDCPWRWRPAPENALQSVTLSVEAFSSAFPGSMLDARTGAPALVAEWLEACGYAP